ncbi:putative ABC transport system ATP-binding protein [Halovenus aranensis]|uniref:Putative ABC transport system ATP-binding protein n=1 Tax=Halovenus aranensis TaxID=890420 RepID=A0A1G8XVA2_9EURY|nr:ABC transporter ATP-binding protein [Halovenus aranensis]SDJ94468.1 putative ABC transport system ATP-binding protein [Halovenus aranensis]
MGAAADRSERSLVTCDDITRMYQQNESRFSRGGGNTVTAIEDISLSIDTAEVVGIAGPSGSGKSTLMHILAALDTPTSGTIEFGGTDIAALSDRERTKFRMETVGLVFQRFYLLQSLSARGNVALPLVERGVSRRERRQRAETMLERVGLDDRVDHRPRSLSGGEQQRVAVARALVTDPALIVADEPTGELDTETGKRVLDALIETTEDRAVVIASHDRRALDRTDRVIELLDGGRRE